MSISILVVDDESDVAGKANHDLGSGPIKRIPSAVVL